ncbi:MAG TPA: peptidylprolyl isomerase [Bacteroidales bacterium]|jgi:peptidyl-prolyl cis-trans isomerase SurA|nr:peptidylprolyl isomerase [Bacteroidales bacterium]
MIKKTISFWALILIVFNVFSQVTVDGIIAIIGKEIILQSDLEKAYVERIASVKSPEYVEEMKCIILQDLIFSKLMIHQADLDSIIITQKELDEQIDARMRDWLLSVGGDAKIIEQHFGKTIAEIKQEMIEPMYNRLIAERITYEITEDITVTPSEVKAYLSQFSEDSLPIIPETFEYGHIVKIPPVSDAEIENIKNRLNEYRERVLKGEKFSMLARLYSDDPGSAAKGGVLGFVERGVLYPEFEAVAFSLKPGEISTIVQTKAGYHIIQMIERKGESINCAHILLQPKPSTEEQVKALEFLDSIRPLIIEENIDFSTAAKRFSDDLTKNNGGWVTNRYTGSFKFDRESTEPATFAVLQKLNVGEYSTPVPYVNEDGVMSYRILYLRERTKEHKANLMDDYDIIKSAALEAKKQEAIDKWILNKVQVTNIKISEKYKSCPFVIEWNIP